MGILDFLFPKRCVSCKTFGSYLCQDCQNKIKQVTETICPMCERASVDGKTHPGCKTRYSLDGFLSFLNYEGPVKNIIHRLKYKPWITELIKLVINSIADSITSNKRQFTGFIMTPIPLHPQRERSRGFNQAGLIGKEIALRLNLEFKDDILKRVRNTKPQVELKAKERRENIKDAFVINKNSEFIIQNSELLLVDDVWTTGGTMRVAANILKRAGAKKVWALTLAR